MRVIADDVPNPSKAIQTDGQATTNSWAVASTMPYESALPSPIVACIPTSASVTDQDSASPPQGLIDLLGSVIGETCMDFFNPLATSELTPSREYEAERHWSASPQEVTPTPVGKVETTSHSSHSPIEASATTFSQPPHGAAQSQS